jgi:hypothetical protein
MAATALKKITTRAKQIRKKNPGISWKSAVKKAGAEYRGGKISGTKKKRKVSGTSTGGARNNRTSTGGARTSTTGNRTSTGGARTTTIRVGRVGALTTAGHLSAARSGLKEQLAWGLLARDQAKTKTAKRKIGKKLIEVRRKLRAL